MADGGVWPPAAHPRGEFVALTALLSWIFPPKPLPAVVIEAPTEQRRSPFRCVGCATQPERFLYMSNGRDYCLDCAKGLAGMYGYRPLGRRAGDITALS